jgi:hypothetical protein
MMYAVLEEAERAAVKVEQHAHFAINGKKVKVHNIALIGVLLLL